MRELSLNRNLFALVDDDDYARLSQYTWSVNSHGYVLRPKDNTYLHREVMNYTGPLNVDHINRNKLDCQKSNLRLATRAQNLANSEPRNPTGYKGVRPINNSKNGTYMARIAWRGKTHYLGSYLRPEDAARAYDRKARELVGPFAYLNFPEEV